MALLQLKRLATQAAANSATHHGLCIVQHCILCTTPLQPHDHLFSTEPLTAANASLQMHGKICHLLFSYGLAPLSITASYSQVMHCKACSHGLLHSCHVPKYAQPLLDLDLSCALPMRADGNVQPSSAATYWGPTAGVCTHELRAQPALASTQPWRCVTPTPQEKCLGPVTPL